MYLSLGGGAVVRKRDIVAICDIDNTSSSWITRDFLNAVEKNGGIVNTADDIPRSFVLCEENGKHTIYLAQPSPAALARRV